MNILIALNENKNLESKLSEHFGHCTHFAIYNINSKNIQYITNTIDHTNTNLTPVDQIMRYKPDMVFTLGIGQKAINLFKQKNIILKTGNYKILKEVIDNIDKLKDITDSCEH